MNPDRADAVPPAHRLLVAGLAAASVGSALIHLAVVPEHWGNYRIAALFFIALAAFQLVWAALVVARPSRELYLVGAAVTLVTIGLWVVSRTTGMPVGPLAHVPEAIGRPDIVSTVLEEFIVLGTLLLAFGRLPEVPLDRPGYLGGVSSLGVGVAAVTLYALAAVRMSHGGMPYSGMAGRGLPGESLVLALGHHGLHLVFAGGAVVVFALAMVARIRRDGMPSFSWSLGLPAARPRPGPVPLSFRPGPARSPAPLPRRLPVS